MTDFVGDSGRVVLVHGIMPVLLGLGSGELLVLHPLLDSLGVLLGVIVDECLPLLQALFLGLRARWPGGGPRERWGKVESSVSTRQSGERCKG